MSITRGIIKFLGGYTRGDMEDYRAVAIRQTMDACQPLQFRVGDVVYINNKDYDPAKAYYLLEAYNGLSGNRWYVSTNKDSKDRYSDQSAGVEELSHTPPERCITCHQIINQKS